MTSQVPNAQRNVLPVHSRSSWQFSLRTLLAMTLVTSCLLAWVTAERARAANERAAWQLIETKGGMTNFNAKPTRATWVCWLLGEDVNSEHACIEFGQSKLTDLDVAKMTALRRVGRLSLQQNPITDRGVAHLGKLAELKYLSLDETNITDAGLDSLHTCKALEQLTLYKTRTTSAGIERLRQSLPKVTISDAEDNEFPPLEARP